MKKNKIKVVGICAAIGAALTYVVFELRRFITSAGGPKAGVINRFWHSRLGYRLGLRSSITPAMVERIEEVIIAVRDRARKNPVKEQETKPPEA